MSVPSGVLGFVPTWKLFATPNCDIAFLLFYRLTLRWRGTTCCLSMLQLQQFSQNSCPLTLVQPSQHPYNFAGDTLRFHSSRPAAERRLDCVHRLPGPH